MLCRRDPVSVSKHVTMAPVGMLLFTNRASLASLRCRPPTPPTGKVAGPPDLSLPAAFFSYYCRVLLPHPRTLLSAPRQ